MELNIATVVSGTEQPVGIGLNGSMRCIIRTKEGTHLKAILKRGGIDEIRTEIFCSLLMDGWGLPVPTPFLIIEKDSLAFASADLTYPNISQRFYLDDIKNAAAKNIATKLACQLVASFKSTPLALAADELIDNRDRNLQNILWDGAVESWIDHGAALGLGNKMPDANKLALMVNKTEESEKVFKSAMVQSLVLTESVIMDAKAALQAYADQKDAVAFILERLPAIRKRIADRFNRHDLFDMP